MQPQGIGSQPIAPEVSPGAITPTETVDWAQRALVRLGFRVEVNGVPDTATTRATTQFQRLERLEDTGRLTPETLERLNVRLSHSPTWLPEQDSSVALTTRARGTTMEERATHVREQLDIPRAGWLARKGGLRRIGLTRGGQLQVARVRDHLNDPSRGHGRTTSLHRQLDALATVDPNVDAELVVAVATREGGPQAINPSLTAINTYNGGGLDFLGSNMGRLELPKGYGRRWRATGPGINERGNATQAARVPRNELVVAYGSQVRSAHQIFEGHIRQEFGEERGQTLLDGLTPAARRAWTQIAFGGPYGAEFRATRRHYGGSFGARTAVGMLRQEMEQGGATDLNDILTNGRLRQYTRVRRGIVTAAEAQLLEDSHTLSRSPARP